MNYPIWDVAFARWIIALVAVVHVFISQFAIGGGLFMVWMEHRGRSAEDPALRQWLKRFARFFAFWTLVVGAVTGVGIWFTIGLISPEATSALIRTFVWVWAIEWVFFLVEIASLLVYVYGWDVLPRKTHLAVGWIYFASAYLSLVAIDGILAFQLTPGSWLESPSLAAAFFNPHFLPSLGFRTLLCLILAGLYALASAAPLSDRILKAEVAKPAALWVALPALLLLPSAWGVFRLLPAERRDMLWASPSVLHAAILLGAALLHLFVLSLLLVYRRPRTFGRPAAVVLLLFGFVAVGATEWAREGLRKPFLVPGYVYANHAATADLPLLREKGLLAAWPYARESALAGREAEAGAEIFRVACSACHGVSKGPRALRPRLAGLDLDYAAALVYRSDSMRAPMPPFPGTPAEARAVAVFLLAGTSPAEPADGAEAFRRRCAPCHSLAGTFRPLAPAFQGMTPQDAADLVSAMDSINEKMPPWSGSDAELKTLAAYLAAPGQGGAP
jgi:mono/diheme cytochrome c family protein